MYRFVILLLFGILFVPAFAQTSDAPEEYQIGISLINIGEIDKRIGSYELDFWYSIQSDNVNLLETAPPEVDFINGRIDDTYSEFKHPQIIEKRLVGKFSSEMNFRDFPFEKIPLKIRIEPLPQWTTDKVVFKVNPSSGLDKSATVPGWTVIESNFYIETSTYSKDSEYSQFVAEYVIQRDPLGSFLKTIFPILIVLGISFVAYMIPKNYDIVTELSLLPLLALVFFHISTLEQLPPLGYLTIFDKLMIIAYVLIANNVVTTGRQIRADEFTGKERAWHLNIFHLKLSPVIIGVLVAIMFFV